MSCVWQFLYRDLLQPSDSFPTMMRKMVIALGAVVSFIPIIVLLQIGFGLTKDTDHGYPRFVAVVVIFIGTWIVAKCTRTAPIWLMALWSNALAIWNIISVLFSPDEPYHFPLLALMIVVILSNAHAKGVNLILPVVGVLLSGYNMSLGRAGKPYLLLMLPGGSDSTSTDLTIGNIQGFAVIFIVIYGLHLQTEEFTRTSAAAVAAVEMSLEVSQKLSLYDTDGARAVLAAYACREQVDGALLTSFGSIVDNLERYRHYLPNYVLNPEEVDSNADERSEASSKTSSEASSPNSTAPGTPKRVSASQIVQPDAPDEVSEFSSNVGPLAVPLAKRPSWKSNSQISVGALECPLTFGLVHYDGPDGAMPHFVDRVHAVARETFTSVHSFIGNTVQLTWNAGRKATQHETKAATFMCRLRENTGDPSVTISGVAASGMGRCQTAGGALLAVLVHIDWLPLLQTLHTIATAHGALLLNEKANATARFHVKTQCVDFIGTSGKDSNPTTVHELLGERVSKVEDEEWITQWRTRREQ